MPVVLPNIAQPDHCKLWLQPGLGLVGLDHGANYPWNDELHDLSNNGNHCKLYGFAKTEASGYRYDAASGLWFLALDGVDDYGVLAKPELLRATSKTFQAWGTIRSTITGFRMLAGLAGVNWWVGFYGTKISPNIMSLSYANASGAQKVVNTANNVVPINTQCLFTYIFTVTGDSVNTQMYVNTTKVADTTLTEGMSVPTQSVGLFAFAPTHYHLHADVAGIMFYDTALSPEDIAQNYALGIGGYSTTYKLQPRPNVTHDSRVTFALHAAKADGANPADNANLLATDISGYGKTATLTNFAGTSQSGAKGNGTLNNPYCYAFDGVDDYIATNADSDRAGVHFYEWWMRSDRKSRNIIFSHGDARPWQGVFEIDYYYILPRLYLGTSNWRYWEKTPAQSDGQWHYWQLYYAGSGQDDITKAALWIDGVLQNVNNTLSSGPQQDAGLALCIGKGCSGYFPGDGTGYFAGDIASFRILNYLPTEAERLQTYQQGPYWPVWVSRVCRSHMEPCVSSVSRKVVAARTTTSHSEPIASAVTRSVRIARVVRSYCESIVSRVSRVVRMARVVTSYCEAIVSRVKLGAPPIRYIHNIVFKVKAEIPAVIKTGATVNAVIKTGVVKAIKLLGRQAKQ